MFYAVCEFGIGMLNITCLIYNLMLFSHTLSSLLCEIISLIFSKGSVGFFKVICGYFGILWTANFGKKKHFSFRQNYGMLKSEGSKTMNNVCLMIKSSGSYPNSHSSRM